MDEEREQDGARGRRANTPERPDTNVIPDDPHASPLGRGANPGTSLEGGPLSASGIAGQHGHQSANARGGPDGMVSRENEDMMQPVRGSPVGHASSANDESA